MRKRVALLGFGLVILAGAIALGIAQTQQTAQQVQRPYTEGSVVFHSYVRTKPGMFKTYMQYLQTDWKRYMEELKAAGVVTNYRVLQAPQRTGDDHDLILVVEHKNMAALDGLNDRLDPILSRVFGSVPQSDQRFIERGALRDNVGERMYRELVLK